MKKVAITGANGFLGSRLCITLKSRNIDFIKIDKSLSGDEKIDINDFNQLETFIKSKNIKTIINCACEPATSKIKKKFILQILLVIKIY